MVTLYGDGIRPQTCHNKAEAIKQARVLKLEAFEVRDDNEDVQVYVEWPQAVWS